MALAGIPLIEHSLRLARLCPEVARTVVSTDSDAIAAVARAAGGDVPFRRPAELAGDDTPMLPVLKHALAELDRERVLYDLVLLLDPTSPGRLPEDVTRAHELLAANPQADGVVAVSEPRFNPIWHCVVEADGYLSHLVPEGRRFGRRQDVSPVFRINAALYLFRAGFLRREHEMWFDGRHLMLQIPEERAFHIDSHEDLVLCNLVLSNGLVRLPWLEFPLECEDAPGAVD